MLFADIILRGNGGGQIGEWRVAQRCFTQGHFDGKKVKWGFPSNLMFIFVPHVKSPRVDFDGNQDNRISPSKFLLVLVTQEKTDIPKFDGKTKNYYFPSNSDLVLQKQTAHLAHDPD